MTLYLVTFSDQSTSCVARMYVGIVSAVVSYTFGYAHSVIQPLSPIHEHLLCLSVSFVSKGKETKSVYEPNGSPGRRLSRFQYHEGTTCISTRRWMECQSIAGLPSSIRTLAWRETPWKYSVMPKNRRQCKGPNPGCSIRRRAYNYETTAPTHLQGVWRTK